jgi:hypothetical protein
MTKPNLSAYRAVATLLFFLCIGRAWAQVLYVDYPPRAWEGKRLIELDKPVTTKVQPYKTPFLDFSAFKGKYPHMEWLPKTMTILPPEEADTVTCAWALALIQDTVHGDRLPILLFYTAVGTPRAMTYIDYNFNGDFRDDGPPMLLGSKMTPRAVEMVSHDKHGYRFYIAEGRMGPVKVEDGKLRPFRLSFFANLTNDKLAYTCAYSEPNRETTVDYSSDRNTIGLSTKLDFSLKSLMVSAKFGLESSASGDSQRSTKTVITYCDFFGYCTTRNSSSFRYNPDTLGNLRLSIGTEVAWMPRIASGFRIGPLISPGVFLYSRNYYTTDRTGDARFKMNPAPYVEGGLQLVADTSPKSFVILRATGFTTRWRPEGFFESFEARDVEITHRGGRIGFGMGLRF